MAKTFTTGLVITGDGTGGVRAFKSVEDAARRFERTVSNATDAAEQFQDQAGDNDAALQTLANTARVAAGALAGVFAVGSLQGQAQLIAETDALSRALAMNTGTMQEWQYAAGQVGIQADKMNDIFKDVSDKFGDYLANAGGEAADLIEKMKLDMQALRALSPDQQLLAIVEAMEQLPDQSIKVNFLESLADDAVRLLPLLENGGAQLRQYAAEARALGVALSDVEIVGIVEADRAMKTLSGTAQGLANQLIIELAPGLTAGVQGLRDWITAAGGAGAVMDQLTDAGTVLAVVYGGKVAMAMAARAKATLDGVAADRAAQLQTAQRIAQEQQAAAMTARRAAGEQTAAVTSARIAAQRAQQAQAEAAEKLRSIQLSQQQLAAERALEMQRLQAQISATGRQQSLTRLAEIRQQELRMAAQATAAERTLAAAKTQSAAATRTLAIANLEQARASTVADVALAKTTVTTRTATAAQWALATATRGASTAMALMGGPVGMAVLAAGGLWLYAQRLEQAKDKTREIKQATDEFRNSLHQLSATEKRVTYTRLMYEAEELKGKIADLERVQRNLANAEGGDPGARADIRRERERVNAQLIEYSAQLETATKNRQALTEAHLEGLKWEQQFKPPVTAPADDKVDKRLDSLRDQAQKWLLELERINATEQQQVENWRTDSLAQTKSYYDQGLINARDYEFAKVAIAEEAARRLQAIEDQRWAKFTAGGLGELGTLQREAQNIEGPRGELIQGGVAKAITDRTFQGLPDAGRLDPQFAGPFGEADRLEQEREKMREAYAARIEEYKLYREMELENAALYDEQIAALEDRRRQNELAADRQIQQAKLQGTSDTFGTMADLARTFAGEQSGIYRAMFAAQKAFSLASVMMSSADAIGKAWNSATFPANLPAVAMTMAETGALQALVQGIAMPVGQAHDGIDYLPKSGTWNLERGERITGAALNRDLTDFLARENRQSAGRGDAGPISVSVEVINNGRPAQAKTRVEQIAEREFIVQVMMEEVVSGHDSSPFNRFAAQHGLARVGR